MYIVSFAEQRLHSDVGSTMLLHKFYTIMTDKSVILLSCKKIH